MSFRALPLHLSAACFLGTLATDLAYSRTAEMMWADFSTWLLTAGLVLGVLAAIACLIDIATRRLMLGAPLVWLYLASLLAVFVLSLFNAFIHSRDVWTSVVPTGLMLSSVTAVTILLAGTFGATINRQYFRRFAR